MTFRGESLRKILDAIEDAVAFRPAKEGDDDEEETRIILIGHSAGGWIARLFLGVEIDKVRREIVIRIQS